MERHKLTNTPQFGVAQKSATNLYLNARSNILLQTACAEVSNPNSTGSSLKTRIILDLGSQRSYVTCRLSETLQLQKIRSENLLVKTFGSSSKQFRVCDVVQVCLKGLTDNLSMYVTCYTVPTICAPLDHQPVEFAATGYPDLNGLHLADSSSRDEGVVIEMLIGADFFWHIAAGQVLRGEHGPVAMETKLGYVLSGPVSGECTGMSTAVNITSIHILKAEAFTLPPEDSIARNSEPEEVGVTR